MTTPTTNIGLGNIQTEFGGSSPISLSEYYCGGANVNISQVKSPVDSEFISTSGTIRIGMFRNLGKFPTGNIVAGGAYVWTLINTNTTSGTNAALLAFNTDGSTTKYGAGSSGPNGWYSSYPQSNLGGLYYIYAEPSYTNSVGEMSTSISIPGFNSSPFFSWLSMDSQRVWALNNVTASSFAQRLLTIKISTTPSDTGLLATYTNVAFEVTVA